MRLQFARFGNSPIIEIVNNGSRNEIALETLQQRRLFGGFVAAAIKGLDPDIQRRTLTLMGDLQGPKLQSFGRYFFEGWIKFQNQDSKSGYHSEGLNEEVLRALLPFDDFRGLAGIDFGFGGGETTQTLNLMGARTIGYDLSPFFVQDARALGMLVSMAAIDQDSSKFAQEFGIQEGSQDFAIATLVLDRLARPLNFIQNLFRCLRPGGRFAIQTILPIIPKDDGPVDRPIIYTLKENQLTPGLDIDSDKIALIQLLEGHQGREIEVVQVPYSVQSLDGMQSYSLWGFKGKKLDLATQSLK